MRGASILVVATVAGGWVGPANRHLPCQACRVPPTRPTTPQMKSQLPVVSTTATAAVGVGLVARVAGVSSFKWLATTVAGSACAMTYGLGILKWWQERPCTIENNAAKALLNSRSALSSSCAPIIPRKYLDDKIRRALDTTVGYVIVEGPRGCGKTTGVIQALTDDDAGVLYVNMNNNEDACASIAKALDVLTQDRPLNQDRRLTQDRLENVLRKATARKKPTIIAELNLVQRPDGYRDHIQTLKEFSADYGLANVIIIVNDADAPFAMPTKDRKRQKVVWVEDFSEEEAHAYLDQCGALPCDRGNPADPNLALRNEVFYEAGTRAMVLAAAAAEWALESTLSRLIIKGARQDGTREVDALVNVEGDNVKANGTAFTRLIIDLLENTSDGWSLQGFDDGDTGGRAASLGLPRELTGAYLVAPGPASEVFQQNGYHAVLYHGPSDSYRFHSTEHRRAAEIMFPEAAARGAAVTCDEVFLYDC